MRNEIVRFCKQKAAQLSDRFFLISLKLPTRSSKALLAFSLMFDGISSGQFGASL